MRIRKEKARSVETEASPIRWGYMRPTHIGLVERIGERWFCKRYGCDLEILTGAVAVTKSGGSGAFRFLYPWGLLRLNPKIKVLRIPSWRRFGNSVVQLVNAFRVAERFNIGTLQFAKSDPLFTGSPSGPFSLDWSQFPSPTLTLEGRYFFLDAFRLGPGAVPEIARILTELVRPMLAESARTPDPAVGDDDVVLHFRGGDIFDTSKSPHASYGQPPLSFYLSALERERPTRVWLVSEDDRNPCLQAVASALTDCAWAGSRTQIVVRRFGNLSEDIRLLMSARRLIASRGSFAYTIAHLSERLRRAYFFEPPTYFSEPASLPILETLGVDVVVARDGDGDFKTKILRHNWANSREQRELMLSYPADRLNFGEPDRLSP